MNCTRCKQPLSERDRMAYGSFCEDCYASGLDFTSGTTYAAVANRRARARPPAVLRQEQSIASALEEIGVRDPEATEPN